MANVKVCHFGHRPASDCAAQCGRGYVRDEFRSNRLSYQPGLRGPRHSQEIAVIHPPSDSPEIEVCHRGSPLSSVSSSTKTLTMAPGFLARSRASTCAFTSCFSFSVSLRFFDMARPQMVGKSHYLVHRRDGSHWRGQAPFAVPQNANGMSAIGPERHLVRRSDMSGVGSHCIPRMAPRRVRHPHLQSVSYAEP
jgi:hypothetical protein